MSTLAQKKDQVSEIKELLESAGGVYVANYEGMTVAKMESLRGEFRKKNISLKVYKNKLVRRAMEEVGGYDSLMETLVNQNIFAIAGEDVAEPAKILKEYLKSESKPTFKAAIIDGDFYGENSLDTLASIKSKNEVIGDILGLLQSPASNVVSALQAQGSNIVAALKTIAEKEQ